MGPTNWEPGPKAIRMVSVGVSFFVGCGALAGRLISALTCDQSTPKRGQEGRCA